MMSCACRAVAVLLALSIAGASIAEEGPNYAEPGYYVALQAGAAFLRDDVSIGWVIDNSNTFSYDQEVGTAAVAGMRLGHRWKHWGLELDGDYVIGEPNSFNLTGNGRWYPWTHRLQPYLLAGMGMSFIRPTHIHFDGDTKFGGTVFALRAGAGLEFYLTEHIFTELGFVYHYMTGPGGREDRDQSFLQPRMGLGYRFF